MRPAGREGSWWLAPTLAFVAVNVALAAAAVIDGFDYLDPWTWARWDSFHYLDISQRGYLIDGCFQMRWGDLFSIKDGVLDLLGIAVEPTHWCGNSGWFPGFPMLIRFVSLSGLSAVAAGLTIAVVAQWGTLVALWTWFLRPYGRVPAYLALAAAAFFFGNVYYRAVFPMSITTFLLIAFLHLLTTERWWFAGLAGALAAFTYPTAFLIAPVTAVWLFVTPRSSMHSRAKAAVICCGLTLVGYLAVMFVQWRDTGVWGAFFKVQSQFDYGIHPPTTRLFDVLGPLFDRGIEMSTVPNLHTGVVAISMVAILGTSTLRWRSLDPASRWVVFAVASLWLFPLMLGGRASLYRIESVLLPVVILIPKMERWLQIAFLSILVAMSYPMGLLFLRNVLI